MYFFANVVSTNIPCPIDYSLLSSDKNMLSNIINPFLGLFKILHSIIFFKCLCHHKIPESCNTDNKVI